jgi:hypothetical protein
LGFEATPPVKVGGAEFRLVPLPGHTRSHYGVALRADDGWLFHCGNAYTYHGTVDPQNPTAPPYYRLFRPFWSLTYAFRAVGKYGARLREAGFPDIDLRDLANLAIQGVAVDYAAGMASLGLPDLTPGRLAEMAIHDVTVADARRAVEKMGANATARRIIERAIRGDL